MENVTTLQNMFTYSWYNLNTLGLTLYVVNKINYNNKNNNT